MDLSSAVEQQKVLTVTAGGTDPSPLLVDPQGGDRLQSEHGVRTVFCVTEGEFSVLLFEGIQSSYFTVAYKTGNK